MEPLNSPIEVGIRILVMLNAAFPSALDMNRLVLFDYSLLHSFDLGGPDSIHPAVPGRSGEMGIKRTLIEQGLTILRRAGLIDVLANTSGILYAASEDADGFLSSMSNEYSLKLTDRASWVTQEFDGLSDSEIRSRLAAIFSAWSEEFDVNPEGLS
ncbi:ABC-three component system middle component 2 [Mycobacterium sp. 852013-50091_SCH5140682]|uniref:ABC-three component system middle component 2 n=1 Tax=Mycobacterium sp. 852013-50091_SCH5140682 TaxID=1834109 RepID=UPI0012E9D7B1|nr:ABC-three component system middle component 2 [Mycobacterium sp. 852013-50091_SCH5140682]